ncbi:MAG: porin family protein [Candidatus Eiseniibacteriota bacterium]
MVRILVSVVVATVGLLAGPALAVDAHFGVKGGLNIANLSADDEADELQDSRKAAGFGGFAHFPVNDFISIQPEVLYMMKGDEEDISGTFDIDGQTIQLDGTVAVEATYLEVPVLARFGFAPGAPARPILLVGPSLAINLSADLVASGESGGSSVDLSEDISDEVKKIDLGLVVGGGMEFPLGAGAQTLGFDARYTFGVTNVDDSGSDGEIKNGVFTVLGTFAFR